MLHRIASILSVPALLSLPCSAAMASTLALQDSDAVLTKTQDAELARQDDGAVLTKTYDVGDLVERTTPLREAPPDGREPELSREARNAAELEQLLRAFVTPPLGDAHSIEVVERSLVVRADAAQQAFVQSFLESQRRHADPATLSLHVVSGRKDAFSELGVPLHGTYDDPALARAHLDRIVRNDFELLSAPKVTVRSLQCAEISTVSQFAYIKAYHTMIDAASASVIADPVVDVIDEGVRCRARVVALPGGAWGLTIDVENVEIVQPVRTKKVRIAAGSDAEGEIMLPEILRARLSGDVRLADGATAVFVAPLTDERDIALFLTVERMATGAQGEPK